MRYFCCSKGICVLKQNFVCVDIEVCCLGFVNNGSEFSLVLSVTIVTQQLTNLLASLS